MRAKLLAIFVVLGILILPVILLLVFMYHDASIRFKQERLRGDRVKNSNVVLITELETRPHPAPQTFYPADLVAQTEMWHEGN